MLKPFYMHILPWDENKALSKAYSSKRPGWIVPVAIAGLLLVGFTWYMELSTAVPYSIIITLLFSLTAIKALFFLFDYGKFQHWVAGMLSRNRGRKVVIVDSLVGVFGLIMIIATLLIF
jgi:hypothetical protein